jgi:hypothetical protein
VHGLGTGVDIGAATPELLHFECRPFLLGRKCPRGRCAVFGAFRFSPVCVVSGPVWTSERRLLNSLRIVPSCLGGSVVGLCGARPRGRCVALGCLVFASFPYKLAVWVWGMPLNIPLYRFLASFPYKLVNFSSF